MPQVSSEQVQTMRPVGNMLVVKPLSAEKVSKGGIAIPDSAQNPPLIGVVVAAGPGRHGESGVLLPMDVAQGDKVAYHRFAGTSVKLSDEEDALILMSSDDVLAVIGPGKKYCACAKELTAA